MDAKLLIDITKKLTDSARKENKKSFVKIYNQEKIVMWHRRDGWMQPNDVLRDLGSRVVNNEAPLSI